MVGSIEHVMDFKVLIRETMATHSPLWHSAEPARMPLTVYGLRWLIGAASLHFCGKLGWLVTQ